MKYIKHIILTAFAMVVMMGAWAQTPAEHCTSDDTKWCFEMPESIMLLEIYYWKDPQLAYNKDKDTTYTDATTHTYPELTCSHNVKDNVRYGSSDPTVATVDKESGVVTPLTVGVTVIYAVHPEDTANDNYAYDSVAYTLTVKEFPGGSGDSEDDPYLIPSLEIWNLLAAKVNAGKAYSGKYFKQTANIENVTTMVGTCGTFGNESTYKQFGGKYNGDGHTLTVDITSTNRAVAPFRFVNGATIRNLKTAGTVTGQWTGGEEGMDIAGIVANSSGETRIVNCISSVALESNKPDNVDAGGIVSYVNNGVVSIDGCAFTGSFNYTDPSGYEGAGIVGWSGENGAIVTNCLFAPSSIAITNKNNFKTFVCNSTSNLTFTNCYYNDKAEDFVLPENKQGKKADTIAAGANVTSLAIDGTAIVYDVSGITCYSKSNVVRSGIMYDGVLYGGAGDVLYLALTHANRAGLHFSSYSATSGTISVSGSDITLEKAAGKSVISADYTATLTVNAEGNGTVSGDGEVAEGTNVDISATPAPDHHFVRWDDGSVEPSRTIHVTRDSTFTAFFAIDTYILDSIPDGWTVTANGAAVTLRTSDIYPNYKQAEIPVGADVAIAPLPENTAKKVSQLELISKTIYLDTLTQDLVVPDGAVLTDTLDPEHNYMVSIADGAHVILQNAVINRNPSVSIQYAGITCEGDATIIIADFTKNSVSGNNLMAGIYVPSNKTVNIKGNGTLTATGGNQSAGIGGNSGFNCGNIVIASSFNGIVNATGSGGGAGIGSGYLGSYATIAISGGTVNATGANGGSGNGAPGIGSGVSGSGGDITIATSVTRVTATKGSDSPNSIGYGSSASCGTVTIGGKEYYDGSDYKNGGYTYLAQPTIVYPTPPPTGAISGRFSIDDNVQVYFSQGNLQHHEGDIWKFADNQWEIIGAGSQNSTHRDLFGWGTKDDPNEIRTEDSYIYYWHEWGENAITNGGNTQNSGWRTLTQNEWNYLFNTRTNASSLYGMAKVNNVKGIIILPDHYTGTAINTAHTDYTNNEISASTWTSDYEAAGAVFLPAAGYRNYYTVYNYEGNDCKGYYWSSTLYGTSNLSSIYLNFSLNSLKTDDFHRRYMGQSVRLVKVVE